MSRFRALLISAAFLFSGCPLGPDFTAPEIPTPESGWLETSGAGARAETNPLALSRWWMLFEDPVLSSLIDRAIISNLDLRSAETRIRQSRALVTVAASPLYPQFGFNSTGRRQASGGGVRSFAIPGSDVETVRQTSPAPTNLFQNGFDLSWELDVFGSIRRSLEAAEADLDASAFDRDAVLVSITAEVGTGYLNLRNLQRQVELQRRVVEIQEETIRLTEKLAAGGFASEADTAAARSQLGLVVADLAQFQAQERQQIYALALLLGEAPEGLVPELERPGSLPRFPAEIPEIVPAEILRNRPDVRRAEANLHAATARVGVAVADLFPQITFSSAGGISSANWGDVLDTDNRNWSIGGGVSLPIFTGWRFWALMEQQQAARDGTLVAYQRAVLNAMREVESAFAALRRARESAAALDESARASARGAELAEKLRSGGLSDRFAALSAESSALRAQSAATNSNAGMLTAAVTVFRSLSVPPPRDVSAPEPELLKSTGPPAR